MKYFDHDTDAAKDELIQALRIECGGAAVDAYWTLLERIYRDETDLVLGENQPLTKSVTHWLCVGWEELAGWISAMRDVGLFSVEEIGDGTLAIRSERASRNIEEYQRRTETARQNGKKGGRKPKANRTLTNQKPNPNRTLTEPKTKEKEKERLLDTHKGYPNNPAGSGAAAEVTAPPPAEARSVPVCPLCSKPARYDPALGSWSCPMCGEIKQPRFEADP